MRYLILVLVLGAAVAMQASAQDSTGRTRLEGLTLEHWRGAGSALFRPTLRLTTYPRRGLGADFALTVHYDDMSFYPPLLTVGPQIGLTLPVRAGPVTFLLKGGPAGIVSLEPFGGDRFFRLSPGAHAGLGVIVPIDRKSSMRLEVGRHVYDAFPYGRVWSFGLGVTGGLRP